MTWLHKFKDAGIPVKAGRVASFMVHNKWSIVNGEFILQVTGNYSAVAFDGAHHAETFETRTGQAHRDAIKREFELLWEEGRVLQWVSNSACFMYLGEDEDETMYPPPGEEDEAVVRYHIVLRDIKPVYKKKKFGKELLLSVFDAPD
uniref:Uncharacterized protein n=1 Tax=Phytophthora ramorum TaxID=164328 RepID=H3H3T3_PHYRM